MLMRGVGSNGDAYGGALSPLRGSFECCVFNRGSAFAPPLPMMYQAFGLRLREVLLIFMALVDDVFCV